VTSPAAGVSAPRVGHRPTARELEGLAWLLRPWWWIHAPRFFDAERVPADRGVLLVGNHTLFGVLDVPLLTLGLYRLRGVYPRALGDHLHFHVPIWRDLLWRLGVVDGTPDNCHALMAAGETILVFPGGAREVFKRKGEQYQLLWKTRAGFVRLALQHGYSIVPFAAVGADECYEILLDAGDVLGSPLGGLVAPLPRVGELPPLVRGIGPTLLPRPERFYFAFGDPIDTASWQTRANDDTFCFTVREQVRTAVEDRLNFLLATRAADPGRSVAGRLHDILPWRRPLEPR
jgi:1-acyl-sn-glycerol-3-phosphate acyltransferase